MQTYEVELYNRRRERLIVTVNAVTIESARVEAVRKATVKYPECAWTDASSRELTTNQTPTS